MFVPIRRPSEKAADGLLLDVIALAIAVVVANITCSTLFPC